MAKQVGLAYKKNSPEKDSQFLALAITVVLWLAALAVGIFVPFGFPKKEEQPVYQSILLNLVPLSPASNQSLWQDATNSPAQELTEVPSGIPAKAAASTQEPISSAGEPIATQEPAPIAPAPPAPTDTSSVATSSSSTKTASTSPPASVPAATAPTPTVPPEPVDVNSLDEADWEALFAQGGGRSYGTSNGKSTSGQPISSSSSSLSGSAATTNSSPITGTTSASSNGAGEQALAQDTESALGRIARAAGGGSGSRSSSGTSTSNSPDSGTRARSGAAMNLVGGGVRQLLHPSEPKITISEENQGLVPGSVEVRITFDITPQGLVLPNSIKITPESLVHPHVQSEIKEQIGKWRFQVAEGSGQVHFKYNIMRK